MAFGTLPPRVILPASPPTSESVLTMPSSELRRTTYNQSPLRERSTYFGDQLVPGRVEERGMRPDSMRTLRIRGRNFGTVMQATNTWSWTNSEEQLTLPTFSAGSIDILSSLRTRGDQPYWQQLSSGSPPTYLLEDGILTSMMQHTPHLKED